ncbi:Nitrate reductase [Aedoeadaptatus coxii]|nr:Nitrate reductase [Peptoniphilus coxii]
MKMKVIQSTCNYCAIDCNLDFHVEDDQIISVVPTKGYPVNDGMACIKGVSLDKQQKVNKTSSLPKLRQADGSMKEVSWDEAMTHVSDKIQEIQEKYGKEAFAGISTGQLTLEEFAIFGHIMRNHLQTNLDGNTRLCMATAAVAHNQSFGFDAPGFTLEDYELSDRLILIGSNPVVAHPIIWDRIKHHNQNENQKLIVIDPRVSETAEHADHHYAIKGKSDLVLLYTVANLLIERDAVDKEFIKNSTNGYEEFKHFVKDFDLKRGTEVTGLSEDEILELVDLIATGKNVSIWFCMGVNQGYEAVRTAQAIINICLMTGNIGRPGTGQIQ